MRSSITVPVSALMLTCASTLASAQSPPNIGIAPVLLTENAYTFDTAEQHKLRVVVAARGLNHPYSFVFLPSGDALIAERGGPLRLVHNATGAAGATPALDPKPITGLPVLEPPYRNAGLNDLALHPQFATNKLVYFTFNKAGAQPPADAKPPVRRDARVALMRAKYVSGALTNVEELFVAPPGYNGGSRIAFGKDGFIYMTTGAPFDDAAQRLDSVYGKVLRLKDDGKVPADNPFVGKGDARPEIYTLGHRDQLGLAVHPVTGAVLSAEHGPNGGDEVNLIQAGHNYGWPKVTFGRNYDGGPLSELPVAEGVDLPLIVWLPSIAPTGLAIYSGDRFPAWKGNLFVGSSRRGEIARTGGLERVVLNDKLEELRRETLLTELHQRIRDVAQAPDGLLYLITDEDEGALLRLEPAT